MKKYIYRVKEVAYTDGSSEFYPEYKILDDEHVMTNNGEWLSCSEQYKKIINSGYLTMKIAQQRIKEHKMELLSINGKGIEKIKYFPQP